jgi:hypothetical protein
LKLLGQWKKGLEAKGTGSGERTERMRRIILVLVGVLLISLVMGTAPAFADSTRLCNNRCASDDDTTINNDIDNSVDNSVEDNSTTNIDNSVDNSVEDNSTTNIDNSVEDNSTNNIDNSTTNNFDNDVQSCTNTISGNNNTVNCT